jgi:dihydropyrimidine dehydrogenase (NAD+) subunit PreA
MFGASLIFLLTHLILEGIAEIRKMNEQLSRFMDENGYNTIQDMRGLALAHIIPNSELEPHIGPPAKIDASCCVGCGICAKIATCRSITITNGRAVVDEGQCECCGLCASVCPCAAISFGKEV